MLKATLKFLAQILGLSNNHDLKDPTKSEIYLKAKQREKDRERKRQLEREQTFDYM